MTSLCPCHWESAHQTSQFGGILVCFLSLIDTTLKSNLVCVWGVILGDIPRSQSAMKGNREEFKAESMERRLLTDSGCLAGSLP